MKLNRILCSALAAAMVLSASVFAAGTKENTKLSDGSGKGGRTQLNDILFEDFTSVDPGTFPAGWSISNNSGEILTEKVDVGSAGKKNCLVLIDKTSDASWGGPTATFALGNHSSGIVGFEIRFKYTPDSSSTYTVFDVLLQNASGKNVVSSFVPSAGGSFVVRNTSTASVPLTKIDVETWVTVKYYVDFEAGRIDAYMKNEGTGLTASQFNLEYATDTKKDVITRLTLMSECYGGTYTIDYVRVTKEDKRLDEVLEEMGTTGPKGVPADMIDGPISHAIAKRINIKVDDKYMATTAKPILSGEEVLVTAKNIATMFNMAYLRTLEGYKIKGKDVEILFAKDGSGAKLGGSSLTLSAAPVIEDVQIFVPIKDVVNALGYECSFDSANNEVVIKTK